MEEPIKFREDKTLIRKFSFIINGSNRIKIFLSLSKGIKTAREIELDINAHLTSICRTLNKMKSNGIIECLNADQHLGKLYTLSPDVIMLKSLVIKRAETKGLL